MNPDLTRTHCADMAHRLNDASGQTHDPHLLLLCAKALEEMARNLPAYTRGITVARPFLIELCDELHQLRSRGDQTPEALHDAAFSLLECLAVIARESSLRGGGKSLPAQADIMSYFESCGHWQPEDGTLVSSFYYSRLPEALRTS